MTDPGLAALPRPETTEADADLAWLLMRAGYGDDDDVKLAAGLGRLCLSQAFTLRRSPELRAAVLKRLETP